MHKIAKEKQLCDKRSYWLRTIGGGSHAAETVGITNCIFCYRRHSTTPLFNQKLTINTFDNYKLNVDNVARLTILAMFSKLANLIISNVASYWFKNWSDFKSTYRIYNLPLSQEHINASLSWSILYIQTFQGGKLEGGGGRGRRQCQYQKTKILALKGHLELRVLKWTLLWAFVAWQSCCTGMPAQHEWFRQRSQCPVG